MTVADIVRKITPKELLSLPDSSTMELVNGEIREKPVSVESSRIEGRFFSKFDAYLSAHPVAEVFPASLGYQCFEESPNRIRKPDTTVVLVDRLKKLSPANPGFMPIVPDLAVEVISPNDRVYEVDEKVREYVDAGFPLIWVADPKARTVTVYPQGGRPVIFTADDEITAEPVLPGFRCKVADFFPVRVSPDKC